MDDPPYNDSPCDYAQYNQDGKCPCTNCLVKMICDPYSACEDFRNFRNIEDPYLNIKR
jgi:hypothetical protein